MSSHHLLNSNATKIYKIGKEIASTKLLFKPNLEKLIGCPDGHMYDLHFNDPRLAINEQISHTTF